MQHLLSIFSIHLIHATELFYEYVQRPALGGPLLVLNLGYRWFHYARYKQSLHEENPQTYDVDIAAFQAANTERYLTKVRVPFHHSCIHESRGYAVLMQLLQSESKSDSARIYRCTVLLEELREKISSSSSHDARNAAPSLMDKRGTVGSFDFRSVRSQGQFEMNLVGIDRYALASFAEVHKHWRPASRFHFIHVVVFFCFFLVIIRSLLLLSCRYPGSKLKRAVVQLDHVAWSEPLIAYSPVE